MSQDSDAAHVIEAARRLYARDNVSIHDSAELSEADGGTWVETWVWVSDDAVTPADEPGSPTQDPCEVQAK
jgi:hypothetical protein